MRRKPVTINPRTMFREGRRQARQGLVPLPPPPEEDRPKTRADCIDGPRPCPWVGCRYHLFVDCVHEGSLKFPYGHDLEMLFAMPQTCALDVSGRGGATLDEVAATINLTRERARQLEEAAMKKFRAVCQLKGLAPEEIMLDHDAGEEDGA